MRMLKYLIAVPVVASVAVTHVSQRTGAGSSRTVAEVLATLPILEGRVPAYYAAGAHDEARRVQQMMEAAADYYPAAIGAALVVELALIGPNEWRSLNANPVPYTHFIPGVRPGPPYIVWVPLGRGHALDGFVQQVSRKSAAVRRLVSSPEELSDRFVALAAFHELGHFYARNGFGDPPGWLSEFVASYLAYAFFSERYPEDARIWEVVCAAFVEHVAPKPRVSGDFHAGQLAENYAWYLGSLQVHVNNAHRQHGPGFLPKLKAAWQDRKSAGDMRPALRLLEQVAPGFHDWVKAHHGGMEAGL
ncbi:MAG: hypothetical protein ACRD15_09725 [Vicinamibacterales bacterium]